MQNTTGKFKWFIEESLMNVKGWWRVSAGQARWVNDAEDGRQSWLVWDPEEHREASNDSISLRE